MCVFKVNSCVGWALLSRPVVAALPLAANAGATSFAAGMNHGTQSSIRWFNINALRSQRINSLIVILYLQIKTTINVSILKH
jgi:hypothetical protein